MTPSFNETEELVGRSGDGDSEAVNELFSRHRDRLERMVRLRIDHRLQGRLDPGDVVQEAHLEASRRLPEYLKDPKLPFFLWIRSITGQKLIDLHRHHLGAQARDLRREVDLYRCHMPDTTSSVLAAQLLGSLETPSEEAIRAEQKLRIQEALDGMEAKDRDVLVLRHFEHLTNAEAAQELGIRESAASNRYVRALKRIRAVLEEISEDWEIS